jgi:glycosyltransferase involved in cell wall biosynthesis
MVNKEKIAPLVSIIMPAYNAANYIQATLHSVYSQRFTDWELIIVNDGSSDDTLNVIEANKRFSVKVITQQNQGVAAARNTGIMAASGSIIAFFDADDIWLDSNLESKVNALVDVSIDFVYSNFEIIDAASKFVKLGQAGTDKEILKQLLLWERDVVPGACSNLLVRRSCFDTVKFDVAFSTAADQDFCFRLSAQYCGKHLNQYTWQYRVHNTSMSRNVALLAKDHIGVYKKANQLGLFHSFTFKQLCFSNMYLILAGNWWVNGNNKRKGLYFIFLSLLYNPMNIVKLMKKI